jgi:hypothetical protein
MEKERKYILYWLDGKTETVTGVSIVDALTKAGYGNGAIRSLDHYKEVKKKK